MVDYANNLIALVRGPIVVVDNSFGSGASQSVQAVPAIGLAYITSYLRKKGYEVVFIDGTGEGLDSQYPLQDYPGFSSQGLQLGEIISRIPKQVKVIGFSGMFSGEWPVMRDLISQTRESFPEALLVAGGEHITALTEYSLRDCPALDIAVRGEGEHTFYKLLEAYLGTGSFSDVPAIAYLDTKGQYQQNGNKTPRLKSIDDLSWPAWPDNYLEKFWEAGKSYVTHTERDMPFLLSRGCPFQCTFCSNPLMWTTKYQFRDLDDAMEEIKYYIKRYNITSIQLYDLTAIIKKSWVMDFTQRMIDENIKIKWSLPSGTRSEVLDKDVLMRLKETNCNYLVYAPESGSQSTLKKIKKRVKLPRLTASALEAKRQGLIIRINLIIGFPHETWREIIQTLLYGLKLSFRGVDEIALFLFSPYPGTEIFNELMEADKIKLNDDYFFELVIRNSEYISADALTFNDNVNGKMLGLARSFFIMFYYFIGYFMHPSRIIRTISNIYTGKVASTVFEHRLTELFNRRNGSNNIKGLGDSSQ
tara:strand:- start:481 stop:2073 length:1593 start_codon:yes stop_codon:yes gene_type:complete